MTTQKMNAAVLQFVQAVQSNADIDLTLRRETASAIIAALQVALRHPHFSESDTFVTQTAEAFCEMLIQACSTGDAGQEYPLVRQMLEAGFDPAHDQ